MKKSALALAVAAGLVGFGSAAYADTTLYGSARVSVDYVDESIDRDLGDFVSGIFDGDGILDVTNNASRLGVRGEEDLGGGLSAVYQYEFGVDVTEGGNLNSNRPKWVGLKGGFGSLTLGTQWTPYYNVIGIGDIFNSTRAFGQYTFLGNAFGLRQDNSVVYSTPNFSGFSLQAMLVMNGACNDAANAVAPTCKADASNKLPGNLSDDLDMWNIGASYKNGPFFVGATYLSLEGPMVNPATRPPTWDSEQWGVALGYNAGPFAVTLSYEDGDVNTVYPDDSKNLYLTGQYTFGPNIIRAAYGHLDPDSNELGVDKIDNFLVGYQYNFSKRTRVWVEYIGRTSDGAYGDGNAVSIGTRHDF